MIKIAIVAGTRPEWIKLRSIIRATAMSGSNLLIVHTGQHHSDNMDDVFFREFGLPKPKWNLGIHNMSHNNMLAKMISTLEGVYKVENPDVVIVQGDTNSALAGAISATKRGIKVVHIEAGLRSYNRGMPEEQNRVIMDAISDMLVFPTYGASNNVKLLNHQEGFVSGNTVCDTVKKFSQGTPLNFAYYYMTIHRPSNTDDEYNLQKLLNQVNNLDEVVVRPKHPRVQYERIHEYKNIRIIEPLPYSENLKYMKHAKAILTDSGGIQEEACILGKPTITIRDDTERPETIDAKTNMLWSGNLIVDIYKAIKNCPRKPANPFNPNNRDNIGHKIVDAILQKYDTQGE